MFLDAQLNREPDFFTHFDCWFDSDFESNQQENLIKYASADPEQLGEVLADILGEWSICNHSIVTYDAAEIAEWYRVMPHEMIESLIGQMLHDAGLLVYCGETFIEAYSPTDKDSDLVQGLMQKMQDADPGCDRIDIAKVLIEVKGGICDWSSAGNVKVHVCDYDNDPDATIPAEFQKLDETSEMDLSKLFFDELLASNETLTGIADLYGSRTLADLMYLQSAIINGGFIDVYEDESKVIDIVKGLPSSTKWMSYIKVEYLMN